MQHVRRPIRIRWWIFAFTLAFPMLSYVQRLSVQDMAETIMPALRLSQLQIGWLATAFTVAYAIAQLPGGIFSQRYGARRTLVIVGTLGCIATLAFPLAPMFFNGAGLFLALLFAQALLGLSRGPLFPAVTALIESWLPANRWAMASGLQPAGMNLGGAATPLLVTLLSASFGWAGALLWVALPVALLTVAWGWYGRNSPREHPRVTPEEILELGGGATDTAQPPTVRRLIKLLGDRNVLLLSLSYSCMNYTFYLLSFWSYLYLVQVRHFSGVEGGLVGAVPWIGAGLGAAAGGFITDWLAQRMGVLWGYRLLPLMALTVAFFMIEVTEGVYGAAIIRVARADVAAAFGALNTGGNLGGIITQPIVGWLTNSGQWGGAFISGAAFALAAGGIWLVIDPRRRAAVD
jgi:ACS family glucarate transporter-like MFS transporter